MMYGIRFLLFSGFAQTSGLKKKDAIERGKIGQIGRIKNAHSTADRFSATETELIPNRSTAVKLIESAKCKTQIQLVKLIGLLLMLTD